ncbi:MAG: calcium-translocating P-type ATPase, PMCA-type [archaeon]
MNYHSLKIDHLFRELNSSKQGLTEQEANLRLEKYGLNEIKEEKKFLALKIFFKQFDSFLVYLLLASSLILYLISFYSNESRIIDASLILIIVFINSIFGFIQDYKAEKSIKALKKLTSKKTIVIRSGKEQEIDSKNIVLGDIIIVQEGDYIPADSRLIEINDFRVDESILTGESKDIEKEISVLNEKTVLAERRNMIYSGTLVTKGKAKALVIGTSLNTEEGKIAKQLQETKETTTVFEKEISLLGKKIGFWIILIIVSMFVILSAFSTEKIFDIFITSVALAVAAIPEGLPAVVTLSLALSTKILAKKNSLIRRLSIIESLGSVDVICVDKTGTLTENSMKITQAYFNNTVYNENNLNSKEIRPLLRASLLTNSAFFNVNYFGDPTEIALLKTCYENKLNKESIKDYKKINEILFTSQRKRKTFLYQYKNRYYAFMEASVEISLERCSHILLNKKRVKLNDKLKRTILEKNKKFASQGLRVIGFSYKESSLKDKDIEQDHVFLGLEAMEDPPRKGVKESIQLCKEAGIRVIMITGDNLITANAIAKQINLEGYSIEGKDLDSMSDLELKNIIDNYSIFARTAPDHKVKILKTLQNKGYIVAMTGDGINDAPALKNADIGISMNIKGTDVAKQTSDIILLDDNFNTIVESIKQGRTIFNNIRKFITYLLTCNLAEVFVVFFLSLFGFLPVTAAQLLWINFVTDGFPALSLSLDKSHKNIMKEKPRNKKDPIINKKLSSLIFGIGIQNSILIIILFFISLYLWDIKVAGTLVFLAFILYEFLVIIAIRRKENLEFFSNKWLIIALSLSFILQLIIIYSPLRELFKLSSLNIVHWLILTIGLCISWISTMIIIKYFDF